MVGRDDFIASIWQVLARQSVLLTSERRLGKTSVMVKMLAEPPVGACPIKRSLQGITSPEEFTKALVADVEQAIPGLLKTSIGERLRRAGVTKVATSPVSVEFRPTSDESWKDVVVATFAVLDSEVDETIVFFWDELPHMIADIRDRDGALAAREVLDVLRACRESHPTVRMVLSGSLGIHHVVDDLRTKGGMWAPTHDMLAIDLPSLHESDAVYLAAELLRNESIECVERAAVATTIAAEVDCIPYYIHHTVFRLRPPQRDPRQPVDAEAVQGVVAAAVADPLDGWQLRHYVDRIPVYYGEKAELVRAILDCAAAAPAPLSLTQLGEGIGAFVESVSPEELRSLTELLCKDYYLAPGEGYTFMRSLVRRAWMAKRRG